MRGLATTRDAYEQALSFLYGRINYERVNELPPQWQGLHLNRMRDLLEAVGNPHQQLPALHVAGTKGKGSTAGMLASILQADNRSVGLYTSPHLEALPERFIVNGEVCREAELAELVDIIRPAVAQLDAAPSLLGGPTFFEITTALAMLHFVRRSVDFAVFEVGMGGRLDSTNVCEPIVSVITNISLDHTQQLGNTLAAIAAEKAGIIKQAVPVVSGVQESEPSDVVRRVAKSQGCPLFELGTDFHYDYFPPDFAADARPPVSALNFRQQIGERDVRYERVELPLLGQHQAANAALAIAVVEQLRTVGIDIPQLAVRDGLCRLSVPARVEIVARRPTTIIDTAHNVASVEALIQVLETIPAPARRVLIFATTVDKDAAGMLSRLLPCFDYVLLTKYRNNPRGVAPAELAGIAARTVSADAVRVEVCDDPRAAWDRYRRESDPNDLVCVAGSFFLAAELRPWIRGDGSI